MSEFIIAAASTADLPLSYFEEHNIDLIRYSYSVGTESHEDDCREETRLRAYEEMRGGAFYSTSMIPAAVYEFFFRKLLKRGMDVLYLDMSQEMSSSYGEAQKAAATIQKEFPNQKLYLMDTRCISGGLGLLLTECVKRKEEGQSFKEVVRWAEENKLHIMHRFTVADLVYLKRGGRVSNIAALVGGILKIKPVLYVPDDGKLVVTKKIRGRKAALDEVVEGVKRDMVNPEGQTVIINHADCLEEAMYVKTQILRAFPTVGHIWITSLGIVIGAHCGPGLIAVFYMGDHRQP